MIQICVTEGWDWKEGREPDQNSGKRYREELLAVKLGPCFFTRSVAIAYILALRVYSLLCVNIPIVFVMSVSFAKYLAMLLVVWEPCFHGLAEISFMT